MWPADTLVWVHRFQLERGTYRTLALPWLRPAVFRTEEPGIGRRSLARRMPLGVEVAEQQAGKDVGREHKANNPELQESRGGLYLLMPEGGRFLAGTCLSESRPAQKHFAGT